MIGLNMFGMWRNARRGDQADIDRMANSWGWRDPSLLWHYKEIWGRIIRPWKWHRIYHSTKHLVVEWCRLESNRAGKLGLDYVSLAFLCGSLITWLLMKL